jgi:hypothetical protein
VAGEERINSRQHDYPLEECGGRDPTLSDLARTSRSRANREPLDKRTANIGIAIEFSQTAVGKIPN